MLSQNVLVKKDIQVLDFVSFGKEIKHKDLATHPANPQVAQWLGTSLPKK